MQAINTNITAGIRRVNDQFEGCFKRGDATALAKLHTPGAVLPPTGMETIQGAEGIQACWRGAMQMGIEHVKRQTQEVEQLADPAIDLSHYTLFGPNSQPIAPDKYLVAWKEQQDQCGCTRIFGIAASQRLPPDQPTGQYLLRR